MLATVGELLARFQPFLLKLAQVGKGSRNFALCEIS
jgi:hypothetical protein